MNNDSSQKMLRMLINGQSKIHENIESVRSDLKKTEERLTEKIEEVKTSLTNRIDKIGLQVAKLEDDTPTVEEFDELKGKVYLQNQ